MLDTDLRHFAQGGLPAVDGGSQDLRSRGIGGISVGPHSEPVQFPSATATQGSCHQRGLRLPAPLAASLAAHRVLVELTCCPSPWLNQDLKNNPRGPPGTRVELEGPHEDKGG